MIGRAQQLFNEQIGLAEPATAVVGGFDAQCAEQLLAGRSTTPQFHALLAHVISCARAGHICIKLTPEGVVPTPAEVHHDTDVDLSEWSRLVNQGAVELPTEGDPLLVRSKEFIYLPRYWQEEERFVRHLNRVLKAPPSLEIPVDVINFCLSEYGEKGLLTEEQERAIRHACTANITIITGGPGTGKTHTAGLLIKLFLEALDAKSLVHPPIALAAPTGKAAANLQKSLTRAMGEEGATILTARTLHSLLRMARGRGRKAEALTAELIVVDESSMIDGQLMARLLASVKSGARLILLGDKDQLPPVEAGGFFADLTQENGPYSHHVASLTQCLRMENRALVDFAQGVRDGQLLPIDGEVVAQSDLTPDQLIQHLPSYFPHIDPSEVKTAALTDLFDRFRILSPLRKGPLGIESLNLACLESCSDQATGSHMAIPVIITVNDYTMDLFNGETGVLVTSSRQTDLKLRLSEGDYALFPSRDGAEPRHIPAMLLPRFDLGYCLSVHKSQGSEFDKVFLVLPEGAEVFGREVLYTAITRAKRNLEFWAEPDVLSQTIQRHVRRMSGISRSVE